MSKEDAVTRIRQKFLDAGKKDETQIIIVAVNLNLPEDRIEKYLNTNLSYEQLVEMMIGMIDGLSDATLDTFASGQTSAEDMKAWRLKSRGDAVIENLAEELATIKGLIENSKTAQPGPDKNAKLLREIKNDVASVKGCVESMEDILIVKKKEADMAEPKSAEPQKANTSAAEATAAVEQTVTSEKEAAEERKKRMQTYQTRMAYPAKEDVEAAAENGQKNTDYLTKDGMLISKEQEREIDKSSFLSVFRRVNENRVKVSYDGAEKKKAFKKIISMKLDEDRLRALSVGASCGVDADTLQKFAQKASSPSQIYNYINIFGAMFIEDFKPVNATA